MNAKTLLTPQQQLFVENYIETLDAVLSVEKAGYKSVSAKKKASELLSNPKILAEIHSQVEKCTNSLNVTQAFIVKKLLQIISVSAQTEAVIDKAGNRTGSNKLHDATTALRAVDILSRYFERKKPENTKCESEDGVKIMCIENLCEDKI